MKKTNKNLSARSYQLLPLLFFFAAPAINAQQYVAVNEPTYTGGVIDLSDDSANDENTEQTEKMELNAIQNTVAKANPDKVANDDKDNLIAAENAPLAQTEVQVKSFSLGAADDFIAKKITDETGEKNISVANATFKRTGGSRTFTLEEIKNVNLNTKFVIKDIDVKDIGNKFTANLKPQHGDYMIEVSGDYSAAIKVPLLTKNIAKGAQISQDDIELKDFPKDSINNGDIKEISSIIGKTTTKALIKGKMVSEEDIRSAILVQKNTTVSAIYETDTLEVKALAVALDDGGAGDVIRLKNFDSGKTFKAVVQADGNVLIGNLKDVRMTDARTKTKIDNVVE